VAAAVVVAVAAAVVVVVEISTDQWEVELWEGRQEDRHPVMDATIEEEVVVVIGETIVWI
jgi:hypothetical protein